MADFQKFKRENEERVSREFKGEEEVYWIVVEKLSEVYPDWKYLLGDNLPDGTTKYSLACEIWWNRDTPREGLPKIIGSIGHLYYLKDGKYHNESGPAIVHPNGYVEYWLNGERVKESDLPLPPK